MAAEEIMAYLFVGLLVLLGIVPLAVVIVRLGRHGLTRRSHLKGLLVAVYCQITALALCLGGAWLSDPRQSPVPGILLFGIFAYWGARTAIDLHREIRTLPVSP